jgi:hypothetical protein
MLLNKYLNSLLIFIHLPLFVICQHEPDVPPPVQKGLYAIWYSKNEQLLDLPYIKGGQIVFQWAELEPTEGNYDFTLMDEELKKMQRSGKLTTLQVNGNKKPVWLYKKIPCHPEKLSPQVGDKQGSLMYWHPEFIKAYSNFIRAYSAHLKQSPYLQVLAGVRMNFNALGTEHTEVPENKRSLDQWKVLPGANQGEEWTKNMAKQYQKQIAETFITAFAGIKLFVRNNIENDLVKIYDPLFTSGKLMWFHTSSEMEPRGRSSENKQHLFKVYAGTGKTQAYAESWADAWGIHGVKRDSRWASPPKWNYWRLLFDLSVGVSMPAIYGNDLEVAYSGKLPEGGISPTYQAEFAKAFKFAAFYTGYHASPSVAPGAWIAFRQNLKNISHDSLKEFRGNYSFLIEQKLPDPSKGLNINNVGPEDQRFGAWAKVLPQGQQMQLMLSNIFANSLNGKKAVVRVVYYDDKKGVFETTFSGRQLKTELKGSQRWKTIEIPVASATFDTSSKGSNIILTALSGNIIFHMVNVQRGNGLPNEVTNAAYKTNNGDAFITWKNPADSDLDSIKIYDGKNLITTIPAIEEKFSISKANKINQLIIKTTDEGGRESEGVLVKLKK